MNYEILEKKKLSLQNEYHFDINFLNYKNYLLI